MASTKCVQPWSPLKLPPFVTSKISINDISGYFLTKRKQRLKSSQPAIEKGRLYRIDFEVNKVESITQLEEGIQVIPYWIDNNRFTLVINSIDKTIASYINKNIHIT